MGKEEKKTVGRIMKASSVGSGGGVYFTGIPLKGIERYPELSILMAEAGVSVHSFLFFTLTEVFKTERSTSMHLKWDTVITSGSEEGIESEVGQKSAMWGTRSLFPTDCNNFPSLSPLLIYPRWYLYMLLNTF